MNTVYIVCAVTLVGLACLMSLYYKAKGGSRPAQSDSNAVTDSGTVCCGKHKVCEKQRLADAMSHRAVYFDDDELDRFAGRGSSDYNDDEIEEFRYILYTMRQEETLEWMESLQVRGIALPDELKDEVCMVMEDSAPQQ